MKSTNKKTHEIDLAPIRAALDAAEKAIVACDENEKGIEAERQSHCKSIDSLSLEDLVAHDDVIMEEARREVRLRIRTNEHAKLCEARHKAATALMGEFLDLQSAAIDSVNREQWELKAKVEEVLQPVIIRYTPNETRFLEDGFLTILDPYYKLSNSIGALDNITPEDDRHNRHGFYKARAAILIKTVEEFNRRGVWLTPEREPAAA